MSGSSRRVTSTSPTSPGRTAETADHRPQRGGRPLLLACCCCDDRGKPTVCNVERVETAVFVTHIRGGFFPLFSLLFFCFLPSCLLIFSFFIYMFLFLLYIIIFLLEISLISCPLISTNILWLPPTPVYFVVFFTYVVSFFFPRGFKFILNFIYLSYCRLNSE